MKCFIQAIFCLALCTQLIGLKAQAQIIKVAPERAHKAQQIETDTPFDGIGLIGEVPDDEYPAFSVPQEQRREELARVLSIYYTRQIDADELRPWSLMHGLLAYGSQSRIVSGTRSVSAVEYLCQNGIGDDRKIMAIQNGRLHMNKGPGYQGHDGQLLAMLAQSDVPATYPVRVDDHEFTIQDLIEYEKANCRLGSELTFQLIALSHYLDSETVWKNSLGEEWSIEKLLTQELGQTINDAACGGVHRLMALSYAIDKRAEQDLPIEGNWERAADYISDYHDYALSLQNEDGSFSTAFFVGKLDEGDNNRKLLTTGHILEWLVFSLPMDKLTDPKVEAAVDFLAHLMLNTKDYKLDVGPRGHALRALNLYESRLFGSSNHAQLMPEGIVRIRQAEAVRPIAVPQTFPNPEGNVQRIPRRFGRRR